MAAPKKSIFKFRDKNEIVEEGKADRARGLLKTYLLSQLLSFLE